MDSKVALVIIFNHKYDKNIPVLQEIYTNRFSNIFFIVPFYTGSTENVISVYENSYYFQGYIAQALPRFYNANFEHYLFIGDDLILNPTIDEFNYKEHFKVNVASSFLPGFVLFHECGPWPRVREAYEYNVRRSGVEVVGELPSYDEAVTALNKVNLHCQPLTYKQLYDVGSSPLQKKSFKDYLKRKYQWAKHLVKKNSFTLPYPLIGSYADIFMISAETIHQFCRYCGVFAATDLHVEIAVPTALVLSTANIVTEKDIDLHGKPLWSVDELKELDKYNLNINTLLTNFPPDYLYLHPVKLSKWKLQQIPV